MAEMARYSRHRVERQSPGDGAGILLSTSLARDGPTPIDARAGLDKAIYTISVASEILETHPRTLMMYEQMLLVIPQRTATNRRRYSPRDLLTLRAIQRLTRQHHLNLNGVRYVIECLQLLDKHGVSRPRALRDLELTDVRL